MAVEIKQQSPAEIPIVLLIAPRSSARDQYCSALRSGGLWTELASNPQEGVEAARELRPDAIVAESDRPGSADLANLARTLRRDESTRHIPLVAVAAGRCASGPHARLQPAEQDQDTADSLVLQVRSVIARAVLLRARVRRLRERSSTLRARSHQALGRAASTLDKAHRFRTCPSCGRGLVYSETRTLHGVVFDYFRPCPGGCGLFGYDRAQHRMLTIIG